MHLKVVRTTFTNRSTIGELYVDDAFECFTLEDMVRPVKVPGMTAIPEGAYVVSVSFSNRFRRLLPEIHNVPNYTGVHDPSGQHRCGHRGVHPGRQDQGQGLHRQQPSGFRQIVRAHPGSRAAREDLHRGDLGCTCGAWPRRSGTGDAGPRGRVPAACAPRSCEGARQSQTLAFEGNPEAILTASALDPTAMLRAGAGE